MLANLPASPVFVPRFPWLGGDLQTLRNTFVGGRDQFATPVGERLLLPMNDGSSDTLAAMLSPTTGNKPLVILLHGLTGCETSPNVLRAHHLFSSAQFPVLRLNFRGSGPSLPTSSSSWCGGSSQDLADALLALDKSLTCNGIFICGVSLGANLLLRFLAEFGENFPLIGAVSVSAPIDLAAASKTLLKPRNAIYQWHLLRQMKKDTGAIALPGETIRKFMATKSIYQFDDVYVAPQHGFEGADHYYESCKALRFLDRIKISTLVIHARNDPWIPARAYDDFDWSANSALTLLFPDSGGHVGFHSRGTTTSWHDACALEFLKKLI
ncbi:MAG: alpha/beta hydrolase [Cohaesibacteraceae bacterium]|nr:alpha/beta hydrolase [Cohaesibacteraceae bacterium]